VSGNALDDGRPMMCHINVTQQLEGVVAYNWPTQGCAAAAPVVAACCCSSALLCKASLLQMLWLLGMAQVCRNKVFLLQSVVYNLPISDMIFHLADQAGYVVADADAGRWVSQTLASQLKMLLVAGSSWASSARLYAWGPS